MQDVSWALYKESKTDGTKTAMDDKCEECWSIWKSAYPWLSWEQLLSENGNFTSDVNSTITEVRQKIRSKAAGMQGPELCDIKEVHLECTRSYLVATEGELRTKLRQSRLSKGLLKGLPTIMLPNDAGTSSEQHFVFKNESSDLRELKVKVVLGMNSAQTFLDRGAHYWEKQGTTHFNHALQSRADEMGLPKLLQQNLPTFESWRQSKFADDEKKQGSSCEHAEEAWGDGDAGDSDPEDDENAMVGVAAAPSIKRAPSQSALSMADSKASQSGTATPRGKQAKPLKAAAAGESGDSKLTKKSSTTDLDAVVKTKEDGGS